MASDDTEATGAAASSGEDPRSGALGLTGKLLANRYRVQSRLGAGGMATVYRAQDESELARQVVVKVPHAALLVDPNFRKRFAGEIRRLSELEHPNIIPIYDVGDDDGVPFAVTKFLAGGDLNARVERAGGTITPEEVLEWLATVAQTLDFVYSRGRLHRDVSPGNIIFDELGNPHLSDFGIATVIRGDDDPDETAQDLANLTKPGGFVGAATYAPPESIKRELNHAYDQYSLAVVVYEALSAEVPFERASSEAVLVAKNTQAPTPLDRYCADLPAGCVAAVMRALSKNPEDRFESSAAFATAFEQGLRSKSAEPATLPESLPAAQGIAPDPGTIAVGAIDLAKHERKPAWKGIAAGGLALAVAGAGAWLLLGSGLELPQAIGDSTGETAVGGPAASIEVTVGSSAAEQEAAFQLCQQASGNDCKLEDYADEQLRSEMIPRVQIDEREVTNREFAAFVTASRAMTTAERQGFSYVPISGGLLAKGTNLSWRAPTPEVGFRDRLDHPVVHVSLEDAQGYCEAQDKRLPTEAEWEYAARGPARSPFPWGEEWSENRAVWRTNGTRPVGSASSGASNDEIQDLAGNVWEWTTTEAPGGSGELFLKGGSWASSDPAQLRGAMHMMAAPADTSADVGFRCVADL